MRIRSIVGSFLLSSSALLAQVLTGTISGVVTDTTQAVVPNAAVAIVSADTGVTAWRGPTNESGVYRAPALPVGRYDISVQVQGFKRADVSGVTLVTDQRASINITLQPGAVAETIEVVGETAGQLATDSSSLSNTINTAQVQNLPLPSRAILNLLSLTAGVSSGGDATSLNAGQLSVNGSRTLNSEFTVDGISVVSGSTGGVQTLPPTDAIREMKVNTSAYSAEYGRTSGATVIVVLNSGSDQYHGGVYEYFRNEDLNANNFFNNVRRQKRPQDRYNLFGVKLGGPIRIPKLYNGKGKTFFFFDYEGLRQSSPYANISSVPNAAFRAGDFSSSPVLIYQPGSNTPFPGNRIPVNMIDPAAAKIFGVLPASNSPGSIDTANGCCINNLVEVGSSKPFSNAYTARIDENISDRDRMFGTFTHYGSTSPYQPYIPGPLENTTGPSFTTGYQGTIGLTQTWTPTFFTELRMGYWRNNAIVLPPPLSAGLDVQSVYGIARSVGPASPTFNITGWTSSNNTAYGLNSNTLRSQIDNNYQPGAAATKVWGNHLVKFGWDLRKNEFNIYNPGGTSVSGWFTGQYAFTGEITSAAHTGGNKTNALADFLLGDIKTSGYSLPQPPAGRRNYYTGLFVQDDWKITRRLTLNLGLRYEHESAMKSSNKIYSRIDPNSGRVLFAGVNASSTLNLEAGKLDFAPRVGAAYSLNPKTVIRAGFGIFYSGIFSDLGAQVLFPGYTVTQSFNSIGTGIPQPFSLSQGMPLLAVQNLSNPQSALAQNGPANPISGSASFAQASPLPYASEWNFGIQRELLRGFILETNYVGSAGVRLQLNLPYNTVPYAAGTQLANINNSVTTQMARPFPNDAGFSAVSMAGHSSYHALQVTARRQYTSNLVFVANYTFSKSINDGDGLFSFSQPEGLHAGQFPSLFRGVERAVSEFDRTNNFTGALQYRTRGNRWVRDFEFNPIVTARTGLPLTVYQSNNLNPAATELRPNVISNNNIYTPIAPNGVAEQYLIPASSSQFPYAPVGPLWVGTGASRTLAIPAGIGTLGRNSVRTPGEFDLDFSFGRKFPLKERLKLDVRAEAFNILNHVNFQAPDTSLSVTGNASNQAVFNSPSFGLITAARAARLMQLVARIEF